MHKTFKRFMLRTIESETGRLCLELSALAVFAVIATIGEVLSGAQVFAALR